LASPFPVWREMVPLSMRRAIFHAGLLRWGVAARSKWLACGLLLAGLTVPRPGLAQAASNVLLESNEQLFSILAAASVAGYDWGVPTETAGEARTRVRAFLGGKALPIVPELRKFFADHRVADDSGSNFGQYVSLALLLGPPPDFRFTVPQTDLPPDAKALVGLAPLLKRFAEQANLTDLWAQLQGLQQREIERYSPLVRRSIERSDAYLGFASGAYLGRTYTIYLSLFGPPEQVHARIYGQNYYLVVTPAKEPKVAEIRHQYLHFLLDPLALKFAAEINQKAEVRSLVRQAPLLGSDFKEDFSLLVTECLIRTAELRMDKRPAAEAEKSVQEMTASGLILAPHFYAALADFEKQEASLSVAYKDMILSIDPLKEKARLATVKFTPKPATVPGTAPPALTEEERLLNQADNFVAEKQYVQAKSAYESVLATMNPRSERALFGLAVVASNTRKPDLAEEYFQKTLEAAQDLRIVTWSHIYLGRLCDLKGKRKEALAQYRAASLTAASYPDALRAVQTGLQKQFGSKQ
jgi:tetratricopeptide (TPR) repeat protein